MKNLARCRLVNTNFISIKIASILLTKLVTKQLKKNKSKCNSITWNDRLIAKSIDFDRFTQFLVIWMNVSTVLLRTKITKYSEFFHLNYGGYHPFSPIRLHKFGLKVLSSSKLITLDIYKHYKTLKKRHLTLLCK